MRLQGGSWGGMRFQEAQFSSVAQSCPALCDPMDCSTPDFPVHYQFQEMLKTHFHQLGDAIQPSHPLWSPSPAFNLSQHQGLFQWVISSHQPSKNMEFQLQHQSFEMNIQDWFPLGLTGLISLQSKRLEFSPAPQCKTINSLSLNFIYSPTLTFIHDYWRNHSFD